MYAYYAMKCIHIRKDISQYSYLRIMEFLCNPATTGLSLVIYSIADMGHWFVTSLISKLSYRNLYCAMCNGESFHELEFWDLELQCEQYNSSQTDIHSFE